MSVEIGIIGGSGLYDMAELTDREERRLATPFGDPSGPYVLGTLRGKRVAFLARHGAGHRLTPSELNFRANIFGFKLLGVDRICSRPAPSAACRRSTGRSTSCSRTSSSTARTGRVSTFFGGGLVAHVAFAHPVCDRCAALMADAAARRRRHASTAAAPTCAWRGRSSRRWPSRSLYRAWGMDIIGMTNLQEAKLAREAEICYATMALVTDYDCWHPDHDAVTVEMIIANLTQNAATAQQVIAGTVERLDGERRAGAAHGAGDGDHHPPRRRPGAASSATWRRSSASTCQSATRLAVASQPPSPVIPDPSPEPRAPT